MLKALPLFLWFLCTALSAGQITYVATGTVTDINYTGGAPSFSSIVLGEAATITFSYDPATPAFYIPFGQTTSAGYNFPRATILIGGSLFEIRPEGQQLNGYLKNDDESFGSFTDAISSIQTYAGAYSVPMTGMEADEMFTVLSPYYGAFGFFFANERSSSPVTPLTSLDLPLSFPGLQEWGLSGFLIQVYGTGGGIEIGGAFNSLQEIPEPGTLSLVAVGAAIAGWRTVKSRAAGSRK